ncbi:hypothetical protein FRC12_004397 [Ceratobasidium sp. 428]|nr:hypothetical protein FRC12_004397 [Ceratobasidium sp. 428]
MSNGSSAASANTNSDPSAFAPSTSAIWINALWFLSLALSVSVSLIVMLAKQWCYSYMSGRSGQPHIQARSRQRRLEELERWKMPEILAFLPTLIHLSLCLIINLWDAHVGVAAPVLATTAITVFFYSLTTVLPIAFELCPYNTPLSQFLKGSPDNIKWLRTTLTNTCLDAAKRVANPQMVMANIASNSLWPIFSRERQRRHGQGGDRKAASDDPNSDSVMDHLTSRSICWLLANSQDIRSVDTALQAIAGADYRLPTKPLLDCGAHGLITQRFRGCFISHPHSGFSFLANPNSADVASLYGRGLEFFMKDRKHLDLVEHALKLGPGGGFAIRRGYQCLQYDLGRTRPNLAAFGLSGVSTWWSMRSHLGQVPPGILKEALVMLERHITSESTLHPVGLVAVIDGISAEAQVWMHKITPRERALYPLALVRLLSQLDQTSLGRARPAIATCLASFAFIFARLYPVQLATASVNMSQSPGLMFLHYYALDDARARDTEALLVYGLLGLLRDREAYELSDSEIDTIVQQLCLVYTIRPPPSGVSFPFIPPPSNLNTVAIQTFLLMLSAETRQTLTSDTLGSLLRALMPYSYMWESKSNTIYKTVAEIFRQPDSGPSRLAWDNWLDSRWTPYYVTDMLHLFDGHHTFQHIASLLGENELEMPAVPFAMRHALSMLDQVFEFDRRTAAWRGGSVMYRGLARSVGCQLVRDGMNPATMTRSSPTELVQPLLEAWITQLDDLKDQVPADILNSGFLILLLRINALNYLSGRVNNLLKYCTTRVSEVRDL